MKPPKAVDVYIAVGSNIQPQKHIIEALSRLKQHAWFKAVSTFYRTAALGHPGQPSFLNGVWHIQSDCAPHVLKFDVLRPIEAELGRIRSEDPCAARPIDLDIALYGEAIINEPDLRVPHPDIRRRPFVAVPLVELAPDFVLPDTGERLSSLPSANATAQLEPLHDFTEDLRARARL